MVKDLYATFGFEKISDGDGNTVWRLNLAGYENKNTVIAVNKE